MYKKILAPLDGSELAECTLEHLRALVSGCNVPEVVLLRVNEPIAAQTLGAVAGVSSTVVDDMVNGIKKEAQRYTRNLAKKLNKEGINATPVVLDGNPAEEILNYAKNNGVDLIIMSSHGRSGIKRWILGSVTNKVLEHSPIPVMTVVPKGVR